MAFSLVSVWINIEQHLSAMLEETPYRTRVENSFYHAIFSFKMVAL
jgi:hypothetical protein